MTYVLAVKKLCATQPDMHLKYLEGLQLSEKKQLVIPKVLCNVSQLFGGHHDLLHRLHSFVKPIATSNKEVCDNSHSEVDTMINSTGIMLCLMNMMSISL